LKGEIEKKNHFKKNKKIKRRTKSVKIIYHKFRSNDEIENKLNFYNRAKKY
jgi:hypothetical protein